MEAINLFIGFVIALIVAVIMIALFPSILNVAKSPLASLNYTDLSFSEQSIISSTFNQFANNLDNCAKNGKTDCLCANAIPNWQFVFDKKYQKSIAIVIIPSSDLKKFNLKMTFNGRDAGMSKEINGNVYIFNGKEEETFSPKFLGIVRVGPSANLKQSNMTITFGTKPTLTIESAQYKNPSADIASANVYKFSGNQIYFIIGNMPAGTHFC
jgi:hypothetical protein